MSIRNSVSGIWVITFCVGCVVACGASDSTSEGDDSRPAGDTRTVTGGRTVSRDPNHEPKEQKSGPAIASHKDSAGSGCWVTLNYCDTPWLEPHPTATCTAEGCADCEYAANVCDTLLDDYCAPGVYKVITTCYP